MRGWMYAVVIIGCDGSGSGIKGCGYEAVQKLRSFLNDCKDPLAAWTHALTENYEARNGIFGDEAQKQKARKEFFESLNRAYSYEGDRLIVSSSSKAAALC